MEINRHKFFLVQVLKEIYSDLELANNLGFKGGTALMLFYDLPRFSTDLDFNLIEKNNALPVFEKIRTIVLRHGKIKDEAVKHFGSVIVLNYGPEERNLKIEISHRTTGDSYETKHFLGIPMQVMCLTDMFSHKLCALLDRNVVANRDIFDCWYLMNKRTPVNTDIILQRTNLSPEDYLDNCIAVIEKQKPNRILSGLGELMNEEMKKFVRTKLLEETLSLLRTYRKFPITT